MKRIEEIKIIIKYLKQDVILTANKYPTLLSDTIVKNGTLIGLYQEELEKLK